MSDTLERRLREAMERRASDVDVPALAPPRVLERTRRRQAGVAALATFTAAVVVAASVIGVRTLLLNRGQGTQLGGGNTATRTVRGVSVTFPQDWHFENVAALASGTGLFIVANYSRGVPIVDVPDNEVCTPAAVLMAVQETYGVPPGPRPAHVWPTTLKPDQPTVRGCGGTETAYWTAAGRNFVATALFGEEASAQDRATMHQVFSSMEFGPAPPGVPPIPMPSPSGTVIARGTDAGTSWVVAVNKSKGGGVSLEVDLPGQGIGIGVPRGPGGQTPVLASQSVSLGSGPGPGARLLVFGFVSHRVSSVHIEPTHEIGTLYPIPGERKLMAFVVVAEPNSHATIVAEDEGGKILDQKRLEPSGPQPSPYRSPAPKASPSP